MQLPAHQIQIQVLTYLFLHISDGPLCCIVFAHLQLLLPQFPILIEYSLQIRAKHMQLKGTPESQVTKELHCIETAKLGTLCCE